VLALAVGMLRPEAWPFVGLYALWLLYEERRRLPWVAAGLVSLPVLWLGPELWGSGNALRASDRAQQPNPDSPAFADNPALEVVDNAIGMIPWAAVAGVVAAIALVALRRAPDGRGRLAAALAALAAAWVVLVALMTSNGFSGNSRYLMPPAAMLIVLGAAGAVWAVSALLGARRPRGAGWVAVAAVLAAAAFALQDAHDVPDQLRGVEYQAELADTLPRVIDRAGGAAELRACGHAYTNPFLVPQVAWHLGVHAQQVDLDPDQERPAVVFHVSTCAARAGRAPRGPSAGRTELAREGTWIVTADCHPGARP
jgi:hypothetical protein